MGLVPPKQISLGGSILAHCTTYISICHILLSKLTKKSQHQLSHKNHHGCLMTSNGLSANDFLYLLSETVINVILTKIVCCADSDLLYISQLRPTPLLGFATYQPQCQPCCEKHCVVA